MVGVKHRHYPCHLSGILLFIVAGIWGTAHAQQATSGEGRKPREMRIEEVLVTARKRTESLQSLAMSVTAFSEQALEDMGADDVADYILHVPGASYTDLGPGNKKIILRGVAINAFNTANVQATVAQYMDEVIVSDGAGPQLDMKLFDVQRVEVLRGPQGTLYGAGSMGGAMRVITNKPDPEELLGKVDYTFSQTDGGGDNHSANAMLNVPILDSIAARVTYYMRDEDGYIDQRASADHPDPGLNNDNINTDETSGGRINLGISPIEPLTINLNYMVQKTDLGMANWYYSRDVGDLVSQIPTPEVQDDEIKVKNLTLNYDFGWSGLTVALARLAGSRDQRISYHESANVQTVAFFAPLVDNFPNTAEIINAIDDDVETVEIRLASQHEGPFEWLIGYFNETAEAHIRADITNPELFTDPRTAGIALALDSTSQLRPIVVRETVDKELYQEAIFGELTLRLFERLGLTFGARSFTTEFERETVQEGAVIFAFSGSTEPVRTDNKTKEDVVTKKYQVEYAFTDSFLVYATAAQGYRVGGVNPTVPSDDPNAIPVDFQSDSLWSYELSAKTEWFNRALTLNGAIYSLDWKDIQLPTASPSGFALIINGGEATVQGEELELIAHPAEGLELHLSASHTDATLDGPVPSLGAVAGDPLPATPEWTGSASLSYTFPLFGSFYATARVDHSYVGKSYAASSSSARESLDLEIGDYKLTNVRFSASNDILGVTAFVNNIKDERTRLVTAPILTQLTTTSQPRTIGINLTYSF